MFTLAPVLFDPDASWKRVVLDKQTPKRVAGISVKLENLAAGAYRITWWDTRTGECVREKTHDTTDGGLRIAAPDFTRDIACRVEPR